MGYYYTLCIELFSFSKLKYFSACNLRDEKKEEIPKNPAQQEKSIIRRRQRAHPWHSVACVYAHIKIEKTFPLKRRGRARVRKRRDPLLLSRRHLKVGACGAAEVGRFKFLAEISSGIVTLISDVNVQSARVALHYAFAHVKREREREEALHNAMPPPGVCSVYVVV